jgi:hypothetical protein
MISSLTGNVLANLAMMSKAARRELPVLVLYGTINVSAVDCDFGRYYHILPPAPDRDTAERTRDILRTRGWRDDVAPEQLKRLSFSLSPPGDLPISPDRRPANLACEDSPLNAAESNLVSNSVIGEAQQHGTETAQAESILERFDGFVDQIDGDTAYVTLKSQEHGDVLYGEYSAALLRSKGIEEQDRFICKTVSLGEATRVDIEAVPVAIVTKEQIQAIDVEIERILPSDDSIDY